MRASAIIQFFNSPVLHLSLLLASITVVEANAQELNQRQRRMRMDSVLAARYYRTPYDTNYVVRPEGTLTLKLRLNQTGNDFHAKGTVNDIYSKADLSTSHKTTVSIGASYRGISASLSLNPTKMSGAYKDYELNLTTTVAASASTSATSARNRWRSTSTATTSCRQWSRATSR